MQTNNHKIADYDLVLDKKFGQILHDARKEANMTQAELAKRTHTTKSYISKIENGIITPSVGAFYRIISALGMRVEVVKPVY